MSGGQFLIFPQVATASSDIITMKITNMQKKVMSDMHCMEWSDMVAVMVGGYYG